MYTRKKKVHVLVVETNRLLRSSIMTFLKRHHEISLTMCEDCQDACKKSQVQQPQVVLLDPNSRGLEGSDLLAILKQSVPAANVVIMNSKLTQKDLVEYVRSGVCGFILREAPFEDYLRTIRSVAEGAKVLPPPLTWSLFAQITADALKNETAPLNPTRLSSRERQIIESIANGLSNKEIAQRLNIAVPTVKTYVHSILEKLHVHTRLEVAHIAHAKILK